MNDGAIHHPPATIPIPHSWYNGPMSDTTERKILSAILATFVVLGLLYSSFVPIFEASDELWHYPMVEHIAQTWTLPVQPLKPGTSSGPWRQEASQPPLYYAIGAALTFWIDTRDPASPYAMTHVRHLNPHVVAGEITPDGSNLNLIVHNPALERFPWQGTALAVHIVRLFSVALGVWAVYLTWALVHELYPAPRQLALTVAAIHAFTPMYLFISSSVNNDNLIVPLCTLALLMMVRMVKTCNLQLASYQRHVRLGIVLGLGLLTKASAIGLLPLAAATIAWETWQGVKWQISKLAHQQTGTGNVAAESTSQLSVSCILHPASFALRSLTALLLPALTLSGWWFYRNRQLYGEWLGLNAFYAVLGTRDVPANFAQLWAERFAFAAGYWGNFGGLNVPMPGWIYTALNIVAVLTFIKIIAQLALWAIGSKPHLSDSASPQPTSKIPNIWPFTWDTQTAARALAWAWPAAVFVSWTTWATITWSSQGRLIFSALPLWSLALAMSYKFQVPSSKFQNLKSKIKNLPSLLFPLFLLTLCFTALPAWILPAYTPPPATRTEPPATHAITFGDTLRLRGYTIEKRTLFPGETVALTLYWESLTPTAADHSLFIHILGDGDRIIAQRDTFPGRGLISTTWLEPGHTWRETYAIAIPPMAYAPDTLTFALGLVDRNRGQRVMITPAAQATPDQTIHFGNVDLLPRPEPAALHFGSGIILTGYDLDALTVAAGNTLTVTLNWRCAAPIAHDYTISVQLLDPQWRKAAQSDAWPLDGAAPTSSWHISQTLDETRALTIAPDAVPSVYDLQLTLYRVGDAGDLEHLPIVWQTGQMPAKTVVLTRVRVVVP